MSIQVKANKGPEHVKLVMSVIFSPAEPENRALEALEKEFGPIDMVSHRICFEHTDYYAQEMGPGLLRRMISFRQLLHPSSLVEIKLRAQAIEDMFRDTMGNRKVNLDPGLLGHAQLILATHKPYSHRIYLDKGIFGEITLIFKEGSFRALDWTYPDYASEPLLGWFQRVRSLYLWQRRHTQQGQEEKH
ncbi:MAG: DUF4416 family protein [bacterium]